MQKVLPILFALLATTIIFGVLLAITRTGPTWPRRIRALDWRRVTGTTPEQDPMPEEAPAE